MELSVGFEDARVLKQRPASRSVGQQRRTPKVRRFGRAKLAWLVYALALAAMLYVGWINRNERHWIPEEGVGYWLGIAGVVAMLLLLVYPLRKRYMSLRFMGSVPAWFRLHMAFGLLGPSLILLHCNFKSESLNASVALYSMLIVAASGLIGRFLYSHVHSALSGRRITATSFFEAATSSATPDSARQRYQLSSRSLDRVTAATTHALAPQRSLLRAIGHASLVSWQIRHLSRSLRREIAAIHADLIRAKAAPRRQLRRERLDFEAEVASHLNAVRRAAGLAVHERLFALWHFLHLPLFLMLVIAVVAHIVAVHLY